MFYLALGSLFTKINKMEVLGFLQILQSPCASSLQGLSVTFSPWSFIGCHMYTHTNTCMPVMCVYT